jgi:hypothetical protein
MDWRRCTHTDTNYKQNVLIGNIKEAGLEIKAAKTTCMFMSRHQTTGQNHYVSVANKSFENAAKLECLRTALTEQNRITRKLRGGAKFGE